MAVLNLNGFETGDLSEAQNTTGTISVVTSPVHSGAYALRINPTAATGNYNMRGPTTTGADAALGLSTLYVSFYLRLAALPGATIFISRASDGTNFIASLQVTSAGEIFIDATAGDSATAATLVADYWHRIDFKVVQNGTCELQVDGGTVVTATGANLTINQVRFGTGTETKDIYLDDIVFDDAGFPSAQYAIRRMAPSADGNYTAWADNLGGNDWEAVDDVPHDSDTSYITSSTATEAETVALEDGPSASIWGTVLGVKSLAIVRDEGGASSIDIRLRSGSTDDDTTNSDPGSAYVLRAKLYNTDPATSAAWVLSALDSVEVGVLNNNNVAVRCTMLCASVLYMPPRLLASTGVGF
jgi:hypothetical protein